MTNHNDESYIQPLDCAAQFDLYADTNAVTGNLERERGYRHCAKFIREYCDPKNGPERPVMLLMYRALKIMVASTEWSCMVNEEQDEIIHAIQEFEKYNRSDPPA